MKHLTRYLLTSILMWCAVENMTVTSEASPDLLALLEDKLTFGSTFLKSITEFIELCEKLAGGYRAVLRVEVHNLANVSMNQGVFLANLGIINDAMPSEVSPGTIEAFTIGQNKPLKGVQIAAYWRIQDGPLALLATEAWQQAMWREPNMLGVSLPKNPAHPDSFAKWKRIMQEYDTKIRSAKYCDENYCIMGIMSNSHHSNVTVRLIPRCISGLSHKFSDRENLPKYQHQLDALLGFSSSSCRIQETTTPTTTTPTTTTPTTEKAIYPMSAGLSLQSEASSTTELHNMNLWLTFIVGVLTLTI